LSILLQIVAFQSSSAIGDQKLQVQISSFIYILFRSLDGYFLMNFWLQFAVF